MELTQQSMGEEGKDSARIGKGRSATVFRVDHEGTPAARKLFTGSKAANLVNTLFYGAPTDYRWCEPAVRAAFYRRRVLRRLVRAWFGERFRVADALGFGFDEEARAYYLDTEFIDGKTADLYTPFHTGEKDEYDELRWHIMPDLQKHLVDAGFVGTVWQAGKGQPCAIGNFLYREETSVRYWYWIDLESGVPAGITYRLPSLLGFYLPHAFKHRRALYDDLDVAVFQDYLETFRELLRTDLGEEEYAAFEADAADLVHAHAEWSKERRFTRSLKFYYRSGRITREQYEQYRNRPAGWYELLVVIALKEAVHKLRQQARDLWARYKSYLNPIKWLRFYGKVIFMRPYRIEISRRFAHRAMDQWRHARRMNDEQAQQLEEELAAADVDQHLADFGVHLTMKPLGYLLRLTLIPFAWQQGWIPAAVATLLFVFTGVILRTTYAFFRVVEDILLRRRPALLALGLSPIPSFGTLAYACQMLHSARSGHLVSQFIIYASCSTTAQQIPVWGGQDSEWDHAFNRVAHTLIHLAER